MKFRGGIDHSFRNSHEFNNGDIVLREAKDEGEPLLCISFSDEVRDMLGDELLAVAEAMIDAAAEFLGEEPVREPVLPSVTPTIH